MSHRRPKDPDRKPGTLPHRPPGVGDTVAPFRGGVREWAQPGVLMDIAEIDRPTGACIARQNPRYVPGWRMRAAEINRRFIPPYVLPGDAILVGLTPDEHARLTELGKIIWAKHHVAARAAIKAHQDAYNAYFALVLEFERRVAEREAISGRYVSPKV